MLEYHPTCEAGTPRDINNFKAVELENFAIFRGTNQEVCGLMVSDDEVASAVVKVYFDPMGHKLWLRPETGAAIYFVPTDVIASDAMVALGQLSRQKNPVAIYAVHSHEPADAPGVAS